MAKQTVIYVDPETHKAFKDQAEKENRTIAAQMRLNAIKLGLIKEK